MRVGTGEEEGGGRACKIGKRPRVAKEGGRGPRRNRKQETGSRKQETEGKKETVVTAG